ncbi:HEPN domain-containing protein [Paenibacillus tundrae]|uniref:ApeA N-terminal domain 1-containing protein n=1 Tax=Paenibacillus tundrae TaxID=528187 RepID=UPI0030D3F390
METIAPQKGTFFITNKPQEHYKGSFSFSQERGGVLEIEGFLTQSEEVVILGKLKDGTLITLLDCFVFSHPFFETEHSITKLYSNFIIEGKHFKCKEEVQINSLEIEYSNLNDWIMKSGFKIEHNDTEQSVVINYILPEVIEVLKTEEYHLSISFNASTPTIYPVQSEARIVQKTSLLIQSDSLSLEDYLTLSFELESFLTLSMITKSKLAYPTKITGRSSGTKIQLYFRHSHRDDLEISFHDMLFTYPEVKDQFTNLVSNWLVKGKILKPVYGLFLELVQRPQLIIEKKFLNIINALEVFHRRTKGGTELSKDQHEERLNKIFEDLKDNEHLMWIKRKLDFSNEISLKNRINQLINDFKLIEEYLGERKDKFVSSVVNTRNFYTHYNTKLEKKALRGVELHSATQELKILTLACLLNEIGFDTEAVNQQIIKYSRSVGIDLINEKYQLEEEISNYLSE